MARTRPPANAWVSEDFINAGEAARRLAEARHLDADRPAPPGFDPTRSPRQPVLVSTAAGYVIGDPPTGGIIRPKQNEGWEKECWAFYDAVGELHYVATQYGRAVSRARLYVAKYNEDGSPEEVKDGEPGKINRQMLGGEAKRGDVLFTSAVQQFISGQSLIIADDKNGRDAFSEQDFSVNQSAARKGADSTVYKVDRGNGRRDFLPEGTLTIHMWDRHPGRSSAVDSSVRPA